MSIFSHKPYKTFNTIHRHPSWFGIPFVLLIVAASFGLQNLTQTRYELQARRVHEVSEEEQLKLKKNRKKIDLREEYFKLRAKPNEDWESVRVPRPEGLPEWGVPPDPPPKKAPEK
ncbi:cytochrome c oxidase assembly protein COX16-domain-containing protein [Gautieria morchelliformis]|nr:cytochrome c oxidase assembly protein COX16-domain-containing protein [Gautieria morchelliformis]